MCCCTWFPGQLRGLRRVAAGSGGALGSRCGGSSLGKETVAASIPLSGKAAGAAHRHWGRTSTSGEQLTQVVSLLLSLRILGRGARVPAQLSWGSPRGSSVSAHRPPCAEEGCSAPLQQGAEDRLQALGRNCNCDASPWSLLAVM